MLGAMVRTGTGCREPLALGPARARPPPGWNGGLPCRSQPAGPHPGRGSCLTLLLVVLLVVLWGSVIVPTLLRARSSPSATVGSFRRNMQALGARSTGRGYHRRPGGPRRAGSSSRSGAAGRWILAPPPRSPRSPGSPRSPAGYSGYSYRPRPSMEQRRRVFVGLVATAGSTFVLGLMPSLGFLLEVHVGVDAVLAGYVWYLLITKPRPRTRREPVTYQPPSRREERPYLRVGHL